MDSLITAAARALAAGDPLGALKRVALRDCGPSVGGRSNRSIGAELGGRRAPHKSAESAPRPGLEPGTHGLTGCVQDWPRPRRDARNAKPRKPIAADLQLRRGGAA